MSTLLLESQLLLRLLLNDVEFYDVFYVRRDKAFPLAMVLLDKRRKGGASITHSLHLDNILDGEQVICNIEDIHV